MNFPKFWAKGIQGDVACWRWSDQSLADAQAQALEAARKLMERFSATDTFPPPYGYGDRPLREQVLREIKGPQGEVTAVITRNAHGCLVLNTARVMFVDVDLPEAPETVVSFFKKLFGKAPPPSAPPAETAALARVEDWTRKHPDWGWRVYRTRAGLRLLATHALFDPAAVLSEPVFDAVGADPLYRKLCQNQQSYRARLTPKPWRCRIGRPPARWPWPDAKSEGWFKDWENGYLRACETKATCALVATLGSPRLHDEVQAILAVHDEATRAASKLALA